MRDALRSLSVVLSSIRRDMKLGSHKQWDSLEEAHCQAAQATSIDAGKGWLSLEKVSVVREALMRATTPLPEDRQVVLRALAILNGEET
jgi:hypothetical protein